MFLARDVIQTGSACAPLTVLWEEHEEAELGSRGEEEETQPESEPVDPDPSLAAETTRETTRSGVWRETVPSSLGVFKASETE